MESDERGALQRFVRENHVHYDVDPEEAMPEGENEVVGFDVRLLASHDGSLKDPTCAKCTSLLSELRGFAARVVASAGAESFTEIVPEPGMLYQSTESRDTDEVAVTLRIRRDEHEQRPEGASEDRRLAAMRKYLESLGVRRHT